MLPEANISNLSLIYPNGQYSRLLDGNCGSFWFHRFMTGCETRMGMIWKDDTAVSAKLLIEVDKEAKARIQACESMEIVHM